MKMGMVGLGGVGMNMARRLLQGGHQIVAYNRSPAKTEELAGEEEKFLNQFILEAYPSYVLQGGDLGR